MHIPVKLMCTHCCLILCCGFYGPRFCSSCSQGVLHIVLVKHILFHCVCGVCVGVCACFHALAYFWGYKKSLPSLPSACGVYTYTVCVLPDIFGWLFVFTCRSFFPFVAVLCVDAAWEGSGGWGAELAALHRIVILILKMYIRYTPKFSELCLLSCSFYILSHWAPLLLSPVKYPLDLDSHWLI